MIHSFFVDGFLCVIYLNGASSLLIRAHRLTKEELLIEKLTKRLIALFRS